MERREPGGTFLKLLLKVGALFRAIIRAMSRFAGIF